MGEGFTAANLDGQLIVWGGCQEQPDGEYSRLSDNVVYSFTPVNLSGKWKVMPATGSVHSGSFHPAFAALDSKIYIFGGQSGGDEWTNVLSTLSANGHFESLSPKGETPSPRIGHQGFTHEGKFYFLGGWVKEIDESRKEDFIAAESNPAWFFTNDFFVYDPRLNLLSRLEIRGKRLSARVSFALAVSGDKVFIHGGSCNSRGIKDFHVLDLKSLEMTEIREYGYWSPMCFHVAVTISERRILFVGGSRPPGEVTNEVKIFDAKETEWSEEEPLPTEIGEGLQLHSAVGFPQENGISVLCLCGYVDASCTTHPSRMVLLEVTHQ